MSQLIQRPVTNFMFLCSRLGTVTLETALLVLLTCFDPRDEPSPSLPVNTPLSVSSDDTSLNPPIRGGVNSLALPLFISASEHSSKTIC